MRSWTAVRLAGLAAIVGAVGLAPAWWIKGHETITEAAARQLPDDVPAFFRASAKSLAHLAGDPDRWKNKETPYLRAVESPNHFLDLEDLDGKPLPPDRLKGIAQMLKQGRDPDKVGLLPYSIAEGFDRLTVAFADYRADPGNPANIQKCVVYAGTLAHYTTDAAMPLHTTRDYDGKPGPNGKTLQKGIHARIDGFPEKNRFDPEEVCRDLEARRIADIWTHTLAFIDESHRHVDRCYALDSAGDVDRPTAVSRAFFMDRCRAGAQLTMDVWYSAWLKSATLPPPY